MPPASTKSKYGKNLQGRVMSVKCEEPINELTVQVWLLYHHPNFKYCTLFLSGTELRTDKRTDRRTIRLLDAPSDLSGQGHENKILVEFQALYDIISHTIEINLALREHIFQKIGRERVKARTLFHTSFFIMTPMQLARKILVKLI